MSGEYPDNKGNMLLMNAMCDMSQFVVVVSVTNESPTTLVEHSSTCAHEVWFVLSHCYRWW